MCGIAGCIGYSDPDRLEKAITQMQNALKHRGPDDQGLYISGDRQAGLAHTRLSILDLSPAGHQPMSTDHGRYWIAFNGEIYNFRQLRETLIAQGETFHSQTDTEVILKLYQKHGPECVNQLRGMFAFAIWDDQEKTAFLARDPLGIKPLYYWQSGSTLLFASELRTLLASGLPPKTLNLKGLYTYLISGSVSEPDTLIQDIYALPAGHWLHWQAGHITQQHYWQIQFNPQPITPTEAKEQVRQALIDSIKYHFVSDVPVGVFLSGGIDSTSLVALARQTQLGQLRTYSIAFEENQWNEGPIAQRIAETFETDHTEYILTAKVARQLMNQFIGAIDQPSIDGFNTYCVSKIAREHGTKVALSGLGGDELFGGYSSFQQVPKMVAWGKRLQFLQPLNCGKLLNQWTKNPKLQRISDFLQHPPNSLNAYLSYRGIFTHPETLQILNHFCPQQDTSTLRPTLEIPPCPSPEDEVSFLEINRYMRNQLLRDSDVMSMAWGLEVRVPFLDRVILDTIDTIPHSLRLSQGKQLLIQAVPELPDWVINKPKQGFLFPFDRWLNDPEWNELFQLTSIGQLSLTPWYRRWSLVILQKWLQNLGISLP
ncbi:MULTISPECIES: asparagine synthase (glutamine-hydrolyzing) [unclassified Roseofilum]|uniref:asparagine synthase (glutamine-hydrolyzing) n=1 Tax=unclassified Roseofilum TaxID=2620099 RepID=UPI000E89C790|nr:MULTISPECIES: asparagine synthase (glutamine-hydrolyzing) [unclassified Roseofilum]MBP0010121.1 asparagine synthase (glutamine-hydrolyzing) [Roseofilum sp. Belize Diploria]MBP0032072.1 asparagine synthase (glutamine-hydrolyzing) [Roseofilum sp. Belize BBD 4]HBQ98145.1 asparagine synthase (glutamine-hydrolyzing) [Cyanobacteria bacterium UBA11691]